MKRYLAKKLIAFMKHFNMAVRFYYPKFSTNQMRHKFGDNEVVGAEIGVWLGENALSLHKNLNIKTLYLVDPYNFDKDYKDYDLKEIPRQDNLGLAFDEAKRRLKDYEHKNYWLTYLSQYAVQRVPDGTLDFVYIDANHKYEYVKKDMSLWWPKLKVGGIMAGHDIDKPEILLAVAEFIVSHKLKADVDYRKSEIKVDFQDWVLFKNKESVKGGKNGV